MTTTEHTFDSKEMVSRWKQRHGVTLEEQLRAAASLHGAEITFHENKRGLFREKAVYTMEWPLNKTHHMFRCMKDIDLFIGHVTILDESWYNG